MVKCVTSDHPGIALVQGFCTGICCLLLGLGCKLAPSADLLSVLRKAQQGQCKRRRSWLEGPSEALLLFRPAAPRGMYRTSRSAESFAQLCCQRLNRGPSGELSAILGATPPSWAGSPLGPQLGVVPGSQEWSWYSYTTQRSSSGQDFIWVDRLVRGNCPSGNSSPSASPIHWRAQLGVLLLLNVAANYSTSDRFLH